MREPSQIMTETRSRPYRLLALVSHVIQYQVPLYRQLAADPRIDLTVVFCSDWGLKDYLDEGFGQNVRWDGLSLEGFRWNLLRNCALRPNPARFFGLFNPDVMWYIRRRRFDALWVHGWASLTNWVAMSTAFLTGVPVLLRAETNLLPVQPPWKKMVKRFVLANLLGRISAALAVGQRNLEFYNEYGVNEARIFRVPYAVNNQYFGEQASKLPPKRELKQKLSIPEDLPVILFCGKLTHVKRPFDLLRAFHDASASLPAALLYVGDGALRQELESYVASNRISHVYFAGFRNQSELSSYFGASDLFVLPSGREPWGLVVNEAMNFGLPILCSDQVGCAADLVHAGVNGMIFPAGNVDALASAIRTILADDSMRSAMGTQSRNLIAKWSYDEDVEGVVAALDAVHLRV